MTMIQSNGNAGTTNDAPSNGACPSSKSESCPASSTRESTTCFRCGIDSQETGGFLVEGECQECRLLRQKRYDRLRRCNLGARHKHLRDWSELRPPDNGVHRWEVAVEAVRAFGQNPKPGVLALVGLRGLGKTQVAALAILKTIDNGHSAVYTTLPELLANLKSCYNSGIAGDGDESWLAQWSEPGLLVIDEITERPDTQWSAMMFSILIDKRYRNESATILCANVLPVQFPDCVGSSIADRVRENGGIVVFDGWSSFRS